MKKLLFTGLFALLLAACFAQKPYKVVFYNFENLFKSGNYNGISGRIYASCSNVFTITKYKGLDPEQTSGMESSIYPRSRTFLLALNLNL